MEQVSTRSPEPDITFEEALARLETVVAELEKGELTLAEALDVFRDGIKNLSICIEYLNVFEDQIEILLSQYYAAAPPWLGGADTGGRSK